MHEDQPLQVRFWQEPVYAGSPSSFPSPADDYLEPDLNVHDLVVDHPLTTYFIRVQGDSMSGACISAGDVVVVDRALTVAHNAIVVARVGNDLLLKRVKMRQRKIYLWRCARNQPWSSPTMTHALWLFPQKLAASVCGVASRSSSARRSFTLITSQCTLPTTPSTRP